MLDTVTSRILPVTGSAGFLNKLLIRLSIHDVTSTPFDYKPQHAVKQYLLLKGNSFSRTSVTASCPLDLLTAIPILK